MCSIKRRFKPTFASKIQFSKGLLTIFMIKKSIMGKLHHKEGASSPQMVRIVTFFLQYLVDFVDGLDVIVVEDEENLVVFS